jgi:hypothetical protein
MTTKRVPDFGRATKKKTAKSGGGLQWKETPESRQRSAAVLLAAQHRPGGPAVQGGLSKSESRALRALARRRAPGRTNDPPYDQGLPSNLEASRMITPERLATLRRGAGLLTAADPPSISGRQQKLQTRKARWNWRGGSNSTGMTKGFRRRGSGPNRSSSASRKSGATNSTGSRATSWTACRRAISKRRTGRGRCSNLQGCAKIDPSQRSQNGFRNTPKPREPARISVRNCEISVACWCKGAARRFEYHTGEAGWGKASQFRHGIQGAENFSPTNVPLGRGVNPVK